MALRRLAVRGFRNLQGVELELDSRANYLFGPNGAGKTNLLEAIHYLAIGRSFRRCPDSEMLGFDSTVLVVAGVTSDGGEAEIRFDGREKRARLNRAGVERLSDYLGWLPVVVLLLDDIELVRGGPAGRRAYLDLAIAKTRREYIGVAGGYRRAVVQYNRLLEQRAAEELRQPWEEELVQTGVKVYEFRLSAAGRLLDSAMRHFAALSGDAARFVYRCSVAEEPAGPEELAAAFRTRLARTRRRAEELGHALVGPHRDELIIERGGRDMRRFGSIGEQRLAAVALRLAEADFVVGNSAREPVFLLDEAASELDERRGRQVLDMVGERGQVVYAAARRFAAQGREFRVEAGTVREVSAA